MSELLFLPLEDARLAAQVPEGVRDRTSALGNIRDNSRIPPIYLTMFETRSRLEEPPKRDIELAEALAVGINASHATTKPLINVPNTITNETWRKTQSESNVFGHLKHVLIMYNKALLKGFIEMHEPAQVVRQASAEWMIGRALLSNLFKKPSYRATSHEPSAFYNPLEMAELRTAFPRICDTLFYMALSKTGRRKNRVEAFLDILSRYDRIKDAPTYVQYTNEHFNGLRSI